MLDFREPRVMLHHYVPMASGISQLVILETLLALETLFMYY